MLQPFLINPVYMFLIGFGLIYFAKKLPFHVGIPRVVGGIIVFITLKPYVINYISSAYLFIGLGIGGLIYLPRLRKIVDRYI